jgi:hypothetical protein
MKRLTWNRVRLRNTALQGEIVMSYEGPDEILYWMQWGEGPDSTAYRAGDLERGERGTRFDSSLYDPSPYDRQELELDRLKAAQEGHVPPQRR